MGRQKTGFNWKSRQKVNGSLDNRETKRLLAQVDLDINYPNGNNVEDSNVLVLPSTKRSFKKKESDSESKRLLSKKRRKQLEKIVDLKAKKLARSELLKSLESVQVQSSELDKMTSLSSIQTKGLKRQFAEDEWKQKMTESGIEIEKTCNVSTKKMKFKKIVKSVENVLNEKDNPHILGFKSESSSSDEESEIELKEEENVIEIKEEKNVKEIKEEPIIILKDSSDDPEKLLNVPVNPINISHSSKNNYRKTIHVPIFRDKSIQLAREKLPIIAEEQSIMEAINENDVVIISGETGSGKTTQVPQFLYEAGYTENGKMIGVTEPRRVAAVSMSKRVAHEMNLTSPEVAYSIRFEGNANESQTKIKFMTDGVLLREIEKDFLLSKYSVIILDEAHERSVFTDILIGLLSRIVPKRNKNDGSHSLKLIIMSATLRVQDFTDNKKLFKNPPPVLKVESRQFDVFAHFNRLTPEDYVAEAFKKVLKIHQKLPEGGILVFLTGQQEVKEMVTQLKLIFPFQSLSKKSKRVNSPLKVETTKEINLDNYNIVEPVNESEENTETMISDMKEKITFGAMSPLWVLPLYSILSSDKQSRIFDEAPPGCRKCVIATNIAETSLTIPGIKYVVDSGKVKTKFYDKVTGVTTYHVTNTSKASSNQRAGRAGRTGPGHCYRLYSSAVYESDFPEFSQPEILKRPVEDLVLQMKSMHLNNLTNFPFPTAPDPLQLHVAEDNLFHLGALQKVSKNNKKNLTVITKLGKSISSFPVAPKFGKMLSLSHQHNLLPYSITMVAALSIQELLLSNPQYNSIRKLWAGTGSSFKLGDPMVLLKAVGAAEYDGCTSDFCDKYGLRRKGILEVRKIRRQLTNEIPNLALDPHMPPPNEEQAELLRQIILSGLCDQVGKRSETNETVGTKKKITYKCGQLAEDVFLHSSSILLDSPPEWLVYQEIFETNGKMYMRGVTAIEPEWLSIYCSSKTHFGSVLSSPPPFYDESSHDIKGYFSATYGRQSWTLPTVLRSYPPGLERTKYFAQYLLEGSVLPAFKKWRCFLLSSPLVINKPWSNLQSRCETLVKELFKHSVDSRDKLIRRFKESPDYLKAAFLKWLPESYHFEVIQEWPPINKE